MTDSSLTNACSRIIDLAEKVHQTNDADHIYQQLAVSLMALKNVNRLIFQEYEAKRNDAESFKEKIDKGNLLLENLRYKQSHLRREIKQCKETHFQHLFQVENDLKDKLIPAVYCSDLASRKVDALKSLDNECKERQALQQQLNSITSEHADSMTLLSKKRKLIDDFPAALSASLEVSLLDQTKKLTNGLNG